MAFTFSLLPALLRVASQLLAPLPFLSAGIAGRSRGGRGGQASPVYCRSRFSSWGRSRVAYMAFGVMPKGSMLPEHASCVRWLVAVAILSLVLRRAKPEMGGQGTAAYPVNKLAGASDLTTLVSISLLLSHRGGEIGVGNKSAAGEIDLGAVRGRFVAASSWCSSSAALRWHLAVLLLTILAERWPCASPAPVTAVHFPIFRRHLVIPPGRQAKREAVSASSRRLAAASSQVAMSPVAVLLAVPRSFSSATSCGGGGLDGFFYIMSRVLSVKCRDVVVLFFLLSVLV